MSDALGYNGWSNYETWLVALWMNNDQISYNTLEHIKTDTGSLYDKAERLEELVRELYVFEPIGMIADLVNAAFTQVNWLEIIQAD